MVFIQGRSDSTQGGGGHASVRRSRSLERVARAVKLKKRSWPAASRRSSTLVMPSLHSSVTCAPAPCQVTQPAATTACPAMVAHHHHVHAPQPEGSLSLLQLHLLSCPAGAASSPAACPITTSSTGKQASLMRLRIAHSWELGTSSPPAC